MRKMARQVMAAVATFDNLSPVLGPTQWKRTDSHKVPNHILSILSNLKQ